MTSFFAVVGFLAAVIFLGGVTVGMAFAAFNTLGRYNIGGVPNSLIQKLVTITFLLLLAGAWYLLMLHSPITISLN